MFLELSDKIVHKFNGRLLQKDGPMQKTICKNKELYKTSLNFSALSSTHSPHFVGLSLVFYSFIVSFGGV